MCWLDRFFDHFSVHLPSPDPARRERMRIEAVVTCVDYADYLQETLPYALPHVDDLMVVTTPTDIRTKHVCSQHSVKCYETDEFSKGGKKFDKAAGINFGLRHLKLDGWVLHMDADTVLPPRTRHMLENAGLDPASIYGIDRVNCVGRAAWDAFRAAPWHSYEWRCLVHAPGRSWPLGSRVAHMAHGGYCPIGFFQLWSPSGSGVRDYAVQEAGTAEHSDVRQAIRWDRRHRHLIPEVIAIHLETRDKGDTRPMGQNWAGRRTPEFNLAETPYVRWSPPDPQKPKY
jgi:hypothetical protein